FKNPQTQRLYVSDYFDLSIYVDAVVDHIETWYLERFQKLFTLAKNDPNNYYHRFNQMTYPEILSIAQNTWNNINIY
ncbi:type I pantothenate kinase, partial [Streptococcus suis]